MKCEIFDIDITKLTAKQLEDRCKSCLENTGGEYCKHIINDRERNTEPSSEEVSKQGND